MILFAISDRARPDHINQGMRARCWHWMLAVAVGGERWTGMDGTEPAKSGTEGVDLDPKITPGVQTLLILSISLV